MSAIDLTLPYAHYYERGKRYKICAMVEGKEICGTAIYAGGAEEIAANPYEKYTVPIFYTSNDKLIGAPTINLKINQVPE